MPDEAVQKQIATSLNNYIAADPKNTVYVFNDNVFVTSKPIKQGQVIEAVALEREDYGANHISHPRLKYVSECVTGHIASRDIPNGTLLSPTDFVPLKVQDKPASEGDKQVVCASHQCSPYIGVFYWAAIVGGLGGLIAFMIGYIWVIVEAFNKSVAWGLGSIFVPFCKSVFEFKNWENARRALNLMVISMFFFSSVTGAVIAWDQQQKNDSASALSFRIDDLLTRLEE